MSFTGYIYIYEQKFTGNIEQVRLNKFKLYFNSEKSVTCKIFNFLKILRVVDFSRNNVIKENTSFIR